MEHGKDDPDPVALDGSPDVKGRGKSKGKKGKGKGQQSPRPEGASPEGAAAVPAATGATSPLSSPSSSTSQSQPAASPSLSASQTLPEATPSPASATSTSSKKQKTVKKNPEQQGPVPGPSGEGQAQGQGDAAQAPQKSKAELKAERRILQEAQRAAKAAKKESGAAKPAPKGETRPPPNVSGDDPSTQKKEEKKLPKQNTPERTNKPKVNPLFSHLRQYNPDFAFRHGHELLNYGKEDSNKLTIGEIPAGEGFLVQNIADRSIFGSNAMAIGMLGSFKDVIENYQLPHNLELARDLEMDIFKNRINNLNQTRLLSVTMRNTIKYLKLFISSIPDGTPNEEALQMLSEAVNKFIIFKICKASDAVALFGRYLIDENECIIVFGFSTTVLQVLEKALNKETLTVLVVDSRPYHEGRIMLRTLKRLGYKCILVSLNTAPAYVRKLSQANGSKAQSMKLLLGPHGVLSNSYVESQIGTAMLASLAHTYNIPVIVCHETYKMSDRAQTDSFVFNELGDPERVADLGHLKPVLSNWKDYRSLDIVNLQYDVTPHQHISTYVTEIGPLPDTCIQKILPTRVTLYET